MKTVFVSGVFNVVHPGHIRLFHFARELGDRLVVGIENDSIAGRRAFVHEDLRFEGVRSNSLVDEAILLSCSPEDFVSSTKPSIVVKGREHENRLNPEQQVVDSYGGRLIFSAGDMSFSSRDLIDQEASTLGSGILQIPSDFSRRRSTTNSLFREHVDNFRNVRALVVGDLIVDEYVTTEALGMSGEEPVLVVQPVDSATFVGGAGIVAAHLASLGASVDFISVVGTDQTAEFARRSLERHGVRAHLIEDQSRPTTQKTRFRCEGKSLLRVSKLSREPVSRDIAGKIRQLVREIDSADLILFSDFNYGVLSNVVIDGLFDELRHVGAVLGADSQSSSQIGDVSRFKGMDFICPTEREARIATRNSADGLVQLAEAVRAQADASNVILTLGADGLLIHARPNAELDWETDQMPALNQNPVDVAGAGDSLFATVGLCMAVGADIFAAAALGSVASAIQVDRIGNVPISADELKLGLGD